MTITMDITHIDRINQIIDFLQTKSDCSFNCPQKNEVYEWLSDLLIKLKYQNLKKKEKGLVKKFISKVTNYSEVQIKRLLTKHKKEGLIWKKWQNNELKRIYTREDVSSLHEVDYAHRLSGPATKEILRREHEVFGNEKFKNLKNISVSHLYNLRKSVSYERMGKVFDKTKSTNVPIGKREKPEAHGEAGYLRVDTVHQGDLNKEKGVYYINIVDEVTQMEFVFSVKAISENYLIPVLQALIKLCPFKIINFHSDNGSEYINYRIASLLNKLYIKQTKSRPRKHNDNALIEGKNGSIIRKTFGYAHIPATDHNAHILNTFCINYLNHYLNFHRPCGYATSYIDHKGKELKKYETYMTPYEKLKSLPNAKKYLKDDINFEELDKIAYKYSDTLYAKIMNSEKEESFKKLCF